MIDSSGQHGDLISQIIKHNESDCQKDLLGLLEAREGISKRHSALVEGFVFDQLHPSPSTSTTWKTGSVADFRAHPTGERPRVDEIKTKAYTQGLPNRRQSAQKQVHPSIDHQIGISSTPLESGHTNDQFRTSTQSDHDQLSESTGSTYVKPIFDLKSSSQSSNSGIGLETNYSDLKTQVSFVFLPKKFCGNSAKLFGNSPKLLRKNFVNLIGLPTIYLDI